MRLARRLRSITDLPHMDSAMARPLNIVTAFAAGAALMFYLDPNQGRRRRALVRDKSLSLSHDMRDYAGRKRTHLGNRMKGLAARAGFAGQQRDGIDDAQLRDEIVQKAALLLSNPMAVEIDVEDGVVHLSGRVPAGESDVLLEKIAAMRGVQEIDDQLDVESSTDGADGSIDDQPRTL